MKSELNNEPDVRWSESFNRRQAVGAIEIISPTLDMTTPLNFKVSDYTIRSGVDKTVLKSVTQIIPVNVVNLVIVNSVDCQSTAGSIV
jgi:hypothetical protein